jgi:hypothetical protein
MVPVNGAGMSGGSSSDRMEMGMTNSGGMMASPGPDSMPGSLEGKELPNMDRMVDAGLTPRDEMGLDDGMFDLDIRKNETATDPMNMDDMGMNMEMDMGLDTEMSGKPFGEMDLTGDEDDDGEMEIY